MSLKDWLKDVESKVRDVIERVGIQAAPQRTPVMIPIPVARPRR